MSKFAMTSVMANISQKYVDSLWVLRASFFEK